MLGDIKCTQYIADSWPCGPQVSWQDAIVCVVLPIGTDRSAAPKCMYIIYFGFSIVVSSVGAVHLQAHRTSLCPGDIVAVFVCEANGTSMIWRVRDNEDNVDKLEHDYGDPEGISVRRNGVSATLLRISAIDQHYLFTSMLTIFDTAGEDIRIKCSSDLSDDASREVQFYYEVPGT